MYIPVVQIEYLRGIRSHIKLEVYILILLVGSLLDLWDGALCPIASGRVLRTSFGAVQYWSVYYRRITQRYLPL